MERVSINIEKRETGKGIAKRLRQKGRVPGVLYGKAVEALPIWVDAIQLEKATKTKSGMNVLIDLAVVGGDSGLARIRDYQADPFKRKFTHVDFQAISLKDKIEVEVPIVLQGTPVGVKEGGVIEQLRRTLHLKSLPDNIPQSIEIDISEMKIGDNVHADDIKLPDGVEFLHTANYTLVAIVPPAKEEVEAVAAPVAEGAEGAAPAEGAAAGAAPAEGAAAGAAPAAAPAAGAKAKGEKAK